MYETGKIEKSKARSQTKDIKGYILFSYDDILPLPALDGHFHGVALNNFS